MTNIFDPQYILKAIPNILRALPVTLQMAAMAALIGWGLGFFIAMAILKKLGS